MEDILQPNTLIVSAPSRIAHRARAYHDLDATDLRDPPFAPPEERFPPGEGFKGFSLFV